MISSSTYIMLKSILRLKVASTCLEDYFSSLNKERTVDIELRIDLLILACQIARNNGTTTTNNIINNNNNNSNINNNNNSSSGNQPFIDTMATNGFLLECIRTLKARDPLVIRHVKFISSFVTHSDIIKSNVLILLLSFSI